MNYLDGDDQTTEHRIALQDFRSSCDRFCIAAAHFERNATTLRANSEALNLCRKLAYEDIANADKCYRNITYRDVYAPAQTDTRQLYNDFSVCATTLKATCIKLLAELDRIDVIASAKLYSVYQDMPGTRILSIQAVPTDIHGDKDLGICCACLDRVSTELTSPGVKEGLTILMKKQDHYRESFMNFATVAIFFTSVTATTLQFSFTNADTTRANTVVNLCWFASLVLGIASAANSFLGAIVYQSPEFLCQPDTSDRRILQTWFAACPSVLLTISGLLFLIGLCSFSFSPVPMGPDISQGKAVQTITLLLALSNIGAIIVVIMLTFLPKPIHLLIHFTIVFLFINLGILSLIPFFLIYLVKHGKVPRSIEDLFWDSNVVLGGHRYRLKFFFIHHWTSLSEFISPKTRRKSNPNSSNEVVDSSDSS